MRPEPDSSQKAGSGRTVLAHFFVARLRFVLYVCKGTLIPKANTSSTKPRLLRELHPKLCDPIT